MWISIALEFHPLDYQKYFSSQMKSTKTKVGVGHFHEEVPILYVQYSEIISAIKPFLNITRIFGIPSFTLIENVVSKGGFWSFLTFLNIFLLVNQLFLLILRLITGEDFVKKSGADIIMRLHVICVHVWSLIYSKKLASALRNSPLVDSRINKVYTAANGLLPSLSLRRKCVFWTVVYVLVGVALTLKSFFIELLVNGASFSEVWENYGKTCGLQKMIFFHPSITSTYCFFMDIATNFVWIFGDVLLIVLSTVMGDMYRRLNNWGIKRIQPSQYTNGEIDLVREHHGSVSKLVSGFDDAIAFLNLINIVGNTSFLILGFYSIQTLRRSERRAMNSSISQLYCKLGVAIAKLILGLIAASVLHYRAHETIYEIRSWPMAREFQDYNVYNGRASVIQAFQAQLSYPKIGFTIGKFATITAKMLALIALGVGIFFIFTRITMSSCSRGSFTRISSLTAST